MFLGVGTEYRQYTDLIVSLCVCVCDTVSVAVLTNIVYISPRHKANQPSDYRS